MPQAEHTHAVAALGIAAATNAIAGSNGDEGDIDAALAAAAGVVAQHTGATALFCGYSGLPRSGGSEDDGAFAGAGWQQAPAMAATVESIDYRVVPQTAQLAGGAHDTLAACAGMPYAVLRLRPVVHQGGQAAPAAEASPGADEHADSEADAHALAQRDQWSRFALRRARAAWRRPAASTARLLGLVARACMNHPLAAPFTEPLDEREYPTYRAEVAAAPHRGRPISLRTLLDNCYGTDTHSLPLPSTVAPDAIEGARRRRALGSRGYASADEFRADLRMLADNCSVFCKTQFQGAYYLRAVPPPAVCCRIHV